METGAMHINYNTGEPCNCALGGDPFQSDPPKVTAALPADFPTDEDVEVACRAFNGTYRDTETREWLQSSWRHDIEDMRVALQAVADARRTEEGKG